MRSLHLVLAFCALAAPAVRGQAPPPGLARQAVIEVQAGTDPEPMRDGRILVGDGAIRRPGGQGGIRSLYGYVATWPAMPWDWAPAALSFASDKGGLVRLSFSGPSPRDDDLWEPTPWVQWRNVRIEGASLAHPGGLRGPTPTDLRRRSFASSADSTLDLWLLVPPGAEVRIAAEMRAARIASLPARPAWAGQDTPAHRAAARLRRGVNLANWLEAPPDDDWGASYSDADLRRIRTEGFDHIRFPVSWNYHTGPAPDYRIDPAFLRRVDEMVDAALRRNLGVILNLHHFDDLIADPDLEGDRFVAIWAQLARHYRTRPAGLVFELLNEPRDPFSGEIMNELYARALAAIRGVPSGRTVLVGVPDFASPDRLADLRLPEDERNVIVSVHNYAPHLFTHQGAHWAMPNAATLGVQYPGPPRQPLLPHPDALAYSPGWTARWLLDYNRLPADLNPSGPIAFQPRLRRAAAYAEWSGRPVRLSEFGAMADVDPASRARYLADVRRTAEELGMGWTLWDWNAFFRYWDPDRQRALPGLRNALFGRP